jgi:hypothetical protein
VGWIAQNTYRVLVSSISTGDGGTPNDREKFICNWKFDVVNGDNKWAARLIEVMSTGICPVPRLVRTSSCGMIRLKSNAQLIAALQ